VDKELFLLMRGQQHANLSSRQRQFSDTLPFYDALYVALAAVLDVPLLTGDPALSKAPGLSCRVTVIS
jgi:predicted nucleic acid-binding protein